MYVIIRGARLKCRVPGNIPLNLSILGALVGGSLHQFDGSLDHSQAKAPTPNMFLTFMIVVSMLRFSPHKSLKTFILLLFCFNIYIFL